VRRNRVCPRCARSRSLRSRLNGQVRGIERAAFTLLELLVAISIIAVLLALILPAIQQARSAARRTECQNHLRNIAIAMLADVDSQRRFPAAGNFGTVAPFTRHHSWVVNVLPWLDARGVFDRWDFGTAYDQPPNRDLANTHLAVLICPDDPSVADGQGNLSYVVNCGFGFTLPIDCPGNWHFATDSVPSPMDLNGNGTTCTPPDAAGADGEPDDRELFKRTGLCFVENWPPGSGTVRYHTFATIRDGTSQTILLSENVRAGYDPGPPASNWANPVAWRTCFFVSGYVCQDNDCSAGRVDYARANDHSSAPYKFEAINSSRDQSEGRAPWPSSYHTGGGVHAAFVDGHVQFLSDRIHGAVYAALVSPAGTSIEGPLTQGIVSDADF
jgi:prepilin-type N-terminal cleavage/methylation domain-containing protein/prepilin-type processing-associated H-X9-DG protein